MPSFREKIEELKKAKPKPKEDLSKGPRPPWIDKLIRKIDSGPKAPPGPQKPF